MIDFIVLESLFPFAVIMQQHGGWVGFFQVGFQPGTRYPVADTR